MKAYYARTNKINFRRQITKLENRDRKLRSLRHKFSLREKQSSDRAKRMRQQHADHADEKPEEGESSACDYWISTKRRKAVFIKELDNKEPAYEVCI